MTITVQPAPNADPARLQVSKNVDALSPQEPADLRRAITQALQLNDTRGFDYFVGWHGVSFAWCEHHDPLFLPWHRAYLHCLEPALQDLVPGVTLPWWDWSSTAAIPEAYTVEQADGAANVLAGAPITVFGAAGGLAGADIPEPRRGHTANSTAALSAGNSLRGRQASVRASPARSRL